MKLKVSICRRDVSLLKRTKCAGWTNKKHHTFLDCLEASFVEQLHRSIVLHADCLKQNRSFLNLSQKLSFENDKASKQFTSSQDDCGKKINNKSDQHIMLVRHGNEYHHIMDLQLCSRLYSEEKQRRDKRTLSPELKFPIHAELQESVSRISEGSGQNFVDEDIEENMSNKKLKTAMTETADGEQVMCINLLSRLKHK